jgi:hypothetical protein
MKIPGWLFLLMLSAPGVYAQGADSLVTSADTTKVDRDILTASDSLSIFNLIDSLLNSDYSLPSQLALRLAYNSNVLSAGRTLGIENFGLSAGLSYYHSKGFYADLTGYYSNDFDPSYYLTVVSAGYMHDFSKRFSIMAGYDRYFYSIATDDWYIPYKNTLSVTPILEFKPFSFSANYSYYFGDQTAHRIMPGVSAILEKRKFLRMDRLAISPSFFMLLGNEVVSRIEYERPNSLQEAFQNYRLYGTRFKPVQINTNVFGVMNYMISIPIVASVSHWSFSFTYNYNIPKALEGEIIDESESTFLSASILYFIDLRPRKNSL